MITISKKAFGQPGNFCICSLEQPFVAIQLVCACFARNTAVRPLPRTLLESKATHLCSPERVGPDGCFLIRSIFCVCLSCLQSLWPPFDYS